MLDLIVKYEIYKHFFILKTNLCSKILAALISDLGSRTTLLLEDVSSSLEEVSSPLEERRIPLEVASSLHSLADSIVLLLPLCNFEEKGCSKISGKLSSTQASQFLTLGLCSWYAPSACPL